MSYDGSMTYENPRYVAYAKAHGKTANEMMAHDMTAWPGGVMCGFILWMSEQKRAFYASKPGAFLDRWTIHDQDAWTAWLNAEAEKAVAP